MPITKPSSCQGCPLYSASTYYVPDEIVPGSEVYVLMQNPGAEEERQGRPACGKTGQALNETYLPLAGLSREEVSVCNVLKCRYGHSNELPPGDILEQAVQHCTQAHLSIPQDAKLVITQGKLALEYAMGTQTSVHAWRGYLVPATRWNIPTYATVHIADTFRDPLMKWVSLLDWRRIYSLRVGTYPAPYPEWVVVDIEYIDVNLVGEFEKAAKQAEYVVIDTEYDPTTLYLTLLGIGIYKDGKLKVYSVNWAEASTQVREMMRHCVHTIAWSVPVVFHNAMADIPVLEDTLDLHPWQYKRVEDSMLAHAVLWCELPHDLEFLASIYGKHRKFKHLAKVDPLLYNYGDVVDTHAVWQGMVSGFKADPAAETIYREQSLKLLPILLEARRSGIRVNKQRVCEVFDTYHTMAKRVEAYAQLMVGYPINLNSGVKLKEYLYDEMNYPLQVNKDTKQPTTNDDAINTLRQTILPVDTSLELTFDKDDEKHVSVLGRVRQGADPILECRALWASTWHTVNNYIVGLCKGVYDATKSGDKRKAREAYWKNGIKSEDVVERIYPNFAIHAQKTGRWSTTNPPLAQLPADLRDLVCPEPDEVCLSWDWSAIEPRILQALTGSTLLKSTFDEGFDLHTWTVCFMFGYDFPPDLVDPHKAPSCAEWRAKYNWKGKDDPRRVFAKQGRYEMWYGGTGAHAAQAAASFGLNANELKQALNKLAASDPAYYSWRIKLEQEVKQTSLIRTFMGRPRRFLSGGDQRRREGLDYPMQGAVSDIFNTTIVLLKERYPFLRWGWGMHDSQKWYITQARLTKEVFDGIKSIVERPHIINGQATTFPADFEVILPPEQGGHKMTPKEYFNTKEVQG